MYISSTHIVAASILAWASLNGALAAPQRANATFPSLRDVTLEDLRKGLDKACFNSSDLVKAYLKRSNEVNGELHAVTEINPDALQIAESLDKERARNKVRGPLHGIPILLKDNIATRDKMNNTGWHLGRALLETQQADDRTAGSTILLGATVAEDSTAARKLREAGAILLGKTNLSQWANFRSGNATNGWSAHGGQVLAAYHANQDPSGSSSGSAVAADVGLAFAAVGTETSGSLLDPSQRSGIVSIKPTVGMTSRHLVIPLSEHQDTVEPMARSVRDAAQLLQVLAGRDAKDSYTMALPVPVPDFAAASNAEALRGARIGVPTNVLKILTSPDEPGMDTELKAFDDALKIMEGAGATIVKVEFAKAQEIADFNETDVLMGADFVVNLASYLGELEPGSSDVRTLAEVRNRTRSSPAEEFPARDTAVWDLILGGTNPLNNTDPLFRTKHEALLELCGKGGLLGALDQHNLGSVMLPTSMSPLWAAAIGSPVVNVPMGQLPANASVEVGIGKLVRRGPLVPYGLSFLGRHWTEADLIGLAFAYEQKTQVRGRLKSLVRPRTEMRGFTDRCPGLSG